MRNPWIDIKSYQTKNRYNFKGRDEELEKFVEICGDNTMSVLYSDSGIGKSSFISAGIVPWLRDLDTPYLPIRIIFEDDSYEDDAGDVEELLIKKIKSVPQWENKLGKENEVSDKSLWWLLHTYEWVYDNEGKKERVYPIIIFDQFEEVFIKGTNQFLSRLFEVIQELSYGSFPSKVDKALNQQNDDTYLKIDHEHHYKVLFSLRKEFLAEFDYWTNDAFSIPELLRNRMRLLPFRPEQAEEVITKQPLFDEQTNEVIEGQYIETLYYIKDDIIEKLNGKGYNEIEPFLLSVLCYRLFELAKSQGKIDSGLQKEDLALNGIAIDTILRTFYEEQISVVFTKQQYIEKFEEILVNERGIRTRPNISELAKVGIDYQTLKNLTKHHLIRTERPIKKDSKANLNDKNWVELIHDKIADVVYNRINERRNITRGRWWSFIWGVSLVLIFFYSIYKLSFSDSRNHVFSDLTEYTDLSLMSNDTSFFKGVNRGLLYDNSMIENLVINDTTEFRVRNCTYLKKIDVNIKDTLFCLSLQNCPSLKELTFSHSVHNLVIKEVVDCPNLEIVVGPSIDTIITTPNRDKTSKISFRIDDNPKFLWEKAFDGQKKENDLKYILWDIKSQSLLYAQCDVPQHFYFPLEIRAKKVSWGSSRGYDYYNSAINNDENIARISDTLNCEPIVEYTRQDVDAIFLGDSVKNICDNAFRTCKNLRKVVLPESLETIGDNAFYGCSQLDTLIIPQRVKTIGKEAFANCQSLRVIIFNSKQNLELQDRAFANCRQLHDVELPDTLLFAGYYYCDNPFFRCYNIKNFRGLQRKTSSLKKDGDLIVRKNDNCPLFILPNFTSYNGEAGDTKEGIFRWRKSIVYLTREGYQSLAKQPSQLRWGDENLFVDNVGKLIINEDIRLEELTIPVTMPKVQWDFLLIPCRLQKITIPYPQPESAKGNEALGFNLPDSVKQRITLYVPYGCKKYYDNHPMFRTFKDVKEVSRLTTYINQLELFYIKTTCSLRLWWSLMAYTIVVLIVSYLFFHYKKASIIKAWWWTTWVFILVYLFFYWLFIAYNLEIPIGKYYIMTDLMVIAIISITIPCIIFWYKDNISQWISVWIETYEKQCDKIKRKREQLLLLNKEENGQLIFLWLRHNWGICLLGIASFVLICTSYSWWRDYNNIGVMVERGNYQRAIELMYQQIAKIDSLSEEQCDSLRNLLELSSTLPDFSDKKILEGVDSVRIASNRYVHLQQNGSVDVFDLISRRLYHFPIGSFFQQTQSGRFATMERNDTIYVCDANDLNHVVNYISKAPGSYICDDYYCLYRDDSTQYYTLDEYPTDVKMLKGKLVKTFPYYSLFITENATFQQTYIIRPINAQEQTDSLPGWGIHFNVNEHVTDRDFFDKVSQTATRLNGRVRMLADDNLLIINDSLKCYWECSTNHMEHIDTSYYHRNYYPTLQMAFVDDGHYCNVVTYDKSSYYYSHSQGGSGSSYNGYDGISFMDNTFLIIQNYGNEYLLEYFTMKGWGKSNNRNLCLRYNCSIGNISIVNHWLYIYYPNQRELEIHNLQTLDDMIRQSPYLSDEQKKRLQEISKPENV